MTNQEIKEALDKIVLIQKSWLKDTFPQFLRKYLILGTVI